MAELPNSKSTAVVLVHGGFVDGSGWEGVYRILRKDGYPVSIVQNPTITLAHDVAATKRIINAQSRPVILVGHSYGGVVVAEAGNDPKVVGLVYIAAFAPDKGESVSSLIKDPPPGAPVPANIASARRLSSLRQGKISRLIRSRCRCRKGSFHGRLSGTVGCRSVGWRDNNAGVEDQAKLVLGSN